MLDAAAYSDAELRQDLLELEREAQQLDEEMENHRQEYRSLTKQGAEADELERERLAQRAKMEKKKLEIKERQRERTLCKLAAVVSIQALRELAEEESGQPDGTEFAAAVDDVDDAAIQERVVERMADVGLEPEHLDAAAEALDVPVLQGDLAVDAGEEDHLMEDVAAGTLDPADVDVGGDAVDAGGDPELGGFDDWEPEGISGEPLVEEPAVEPRIERVPEYDLLEVTFERDGEPLATVSIRDGAYSAAWTQEATIGDLLEWVAADESVPADPRAEASFAGADGEPPERVTASLSALREDERFPGRCRFLAVAGDGVEGSWEDDPGLAGAEVALNVTDGEGDTFDRYFRRARSGALPMDEVASVLGRTEELLEEHGGTG